MSTIKQDRKDLEMLLNGISPIEAQPSNTSQAQPSNQPAPSTVSTTATSSVIDKSGSEMGVENVFEFNYDSIRKGVRKKARKTVLNISKHILTDDMLEEEYVQDKMEQDIETLTDLYMQIETNTLMQKALVNTVARGNMMPRYFEVFGQLTEKISSLNKQIVNTEQTIRKTYLDLKFEIRDKKEEEFNLNGQQSLKLDTTASSNGNVLVTSSLDLIAKAKAKHRETLEKAQQTTYIEE